MGNKEEDKSNLPRHLRNVPDKFKFLTEAYKPEPDPNAIKHLGALNGWGKNDIPIPQEYMQCQRKQGRPHKLEVTELGRPGRGYKSYRCTKCNIEWIVDSTD